MLDYTNELQYYELTDEEIEELPLIIADNCCNVISHDRIVATAAGKKACTQGQKDLAKDLLLNTYQHSSDGPQLITAARLREIFRYKGLLE